MKEILKLTIEENELASIPFIFDKRSHSLDLEIGMKIKIKVKYEENDVISEKYIIIPIHDIKESEFKRLLFFKGCANIPLEISRDIFLKLY